MLTPDFVAKVQSGSPVTPAGANPAHQDLSDDSAFDSWKTSITQPTPQSSGGIGGVVKSLVEAPATMIARPFQAAADLGDYLGTRIEDNNATTPGAKSAILSAEQQRATKNQSTTSGPGGLVAPTPANGADLKKDAGRAAETVALGMGPVSGGALFGAGNSVEQGNNLFSPETAVQTVLGAFAGKTLDLAGKPILNASGQAVAKITPQFLHDVAVRGTQAITDLANHYKILPDAVSHAINSGAETAEKVADAPFKAATATAKAVVSPLKNAKETFQASRGNANNRGLAAPATRLAKQAPLIGAGAAREPKMSDMYNQAVNDSNAHLDDPTMVDKPIEKFGQNEVSNAFDQVVKQRQAAGKAMSDELDNPKVGNIKTDVKDAKQAIVGDLNKQKLDYDSKEKKILSLEGQSPMGSSDRAMVENYLNDLHTLKNKPTVSDVNNFIQRTNADLDLYKSKNAIMGTTNGEKIIKANLAKLRETISADATKNSALKPYSDAKAEYARLSPTIERGISLLGKPDINGGYIRDASVAKRAVQSITNGGTKDFMKSLEKETGKPLLDHAYVILQAMKDTGDTSAHSLLDMFAKDASEGKMPSAETIRGKLMQFITKHAVDKVAGSPVEQTQAFLKSIEDARKAPSSPTAGSMADKAKGIFKDIKNNGNRGFVKVPMPKMTPEDIAANMDDSDFNILKSYIEKPSDVNTYTKVQDMFDSMGIGKMAEEDQHRFVQDTLAHYEKETTQTIKAKDLDKPGLKLAQ